MSIATGRQATVSVEIGGREITFETGKLAKQADGAVVVRSGDTMILATAVGRTESRPDADFFPLTIDVEERMYAAGKIPGGFFKREGKASERATLTARMIDRPIRPLWPKGFRNEVQVICTVLSADMIHGHDVLCINGASAALAISPLPFLGPVGAVRVARIDGELVVNPTLQEADEDSDLDLIVVGTRDALTMIEAGADQVPEDDDAARRSSSRTPRSSASATSIDDLRDAGRQAEVGRSGPDGRARVRRTATRSGGASRSRASRRPSAIVDEIVDEVCPDITLDSTEDDMVREMQVKGGLALVLDKQRLVAVEGPVREQFESDLRELTDAEQDSKYLKSRKRGMLYDRIVENVQLPFPVSDGESDGQGRDDEGRGSRRRPTRSTRTSSARRSPSTSAGPTVAARRRSGRSASRSASRRGRTAPACSRAARRRS